MTEKDLIKNHILKLKSELVRGSCASQVAMETNCKEEAYDEILKFIEFLDGNDEIIMNVFLAKDKDNAPGNLFMFYPEYMKEFDCYQGMPVLISDKDFLKDVNDPVEVELKIRKV